MRAADSCGSRLVGRAVQRAQAVGARRARIGQAQAREVGGGVERRHARCEACQAGRPRATFATDAGSVPSMPRPMLRTAALACLLLALLVPAGASAAGRADTARSLAALMRQAGPSSGALVVDLDSGRRL